MILACSMRRRLRSPPGSVFVLHQAATGSTGYQCLQTDMGTPCDGG